MDYISRDPSKIFNSVGANDSFVTICLDTNSDEFKKIGSPLSGILHYTQNQRKYFLGEDIKLGVQENISFLKLNTLGLNYAPEIKKSLIQEGISIHSIEQIIVTPQDDIQHEIPKSHKNKIIVPLEPEKDALETEKLLVFLYQRYLNSGIKFLKSEKEKFVGVYVGLLGAFPEEILVKIELDPSDLRTNWRIHHHYLSTKKKREGLTDSENDRLKKCEVKFFWKVVLSMVRELKQLNVTKSECAEMREVLKEILIEMSFIEDDRLNFDSPTIYWNRETLLHIVLRHLYNVKIKRLKKSTIPYSLADLQILVKRIVDMIYFEWKEYSEKKPGKKFSKYGAESMYYNGDYYVIHIAADGRIESFYTVD